MTFWDIFISSKFRKTVETILFHFSYLVKTSISFEDFLANKTLGKINSFRAIAFLGKTISKHQKTFIELHLRLLLLQIVLLKNITLRIEFQLENKSCLLGKYFQNNFNNHKNQINLRRLRVREQFEKEWIKLITISLLCQRILHILWRLWLVVNFDLQYGTFT